MSKKRKPIVVLMSPVAYKAFEEWLRQHKEYEYQQSERENTQHENIKEVDHGTGN